jgi:MFS family permease
MSRTQPTPLPLKELAILATIIMAEPLSFSIIFPFQYSLVSQWVELEKVGYYAGFLASCFSLSQFCSSLFWGWASDRIGRRPILLIGLLGNTISIIIFGFSNSLTMALFARSLNGLLNGNSGVAKSVLAELTDVTNRPRAFSVFGLTFALGLTLGPIIGGFLAYPAKTMPSIFGNINLFKVNPFLLPCLASSVISFLGFVFGLHFLPETNPRLSRISRTEEVIEEEQSLLEDYASDEVVQDVVPPDSDNSIGMPAISSVIAYTLLCFLIVCFDEVYSIWGNSPIGIGLGFSPAELGASLSPQGIVLIFTQISIYPWISQRIDQLRLYRIVTSIFPIVFIAYPVLSSVIRVNPDLDPIWTWPILEILLAFRFCLGTICFTSVMLLVSNSAKPGQLGRVNGYGQMYASLVRTIGPTLAGSLFAWSQGNGFAFPLDKHLIWLFLGAISLLCAFQANAMRFR